MTESSHYTDSSSYEVPRKPSVYEDLGGGLKTYYDTGKLPRLGSHNGRQPLTGRAALGPAIRRERREHYDSVLGTGRDVSAPPEQLAKNRERLQQLQSLLSETVITQEVEPPAMIEQLSLPFSLGPEPSHQEPK